MSIRKKTPIRLASWSQIRRRGDAFLLMGRHVKGDEFIVAIHPNRQEAVAACIAYMGAREAERIPGGQFDVVVEKTLQG